MADSNRIPALNRFPRMMQEYTTTRLRENYRANHARVMGLQTRAEDKAAYYVGPGTHGYWQGAREAMCAFFNRQTGVTAPSPEGALVLEKPEALRCTPTGQVSDLQGVQCVPALTAARSRELAATRGTPSGEELRRRVTAVLRLPERQGAPDYRVLRPWNDRGYARTHANQFVLGHAARRARSVRSAGCVPGTGCGQETLVDRTPKRGHDGPSTGHVTCE